MEPGNHLSRGPDILPPPTESGPVSGPDNSPLKPETYPVAPEAAKLPSQAMPSSAAAPSVAGGDPLQLTTPVDDSQSNAAADYSDNPVRRQHKSVEELKKSYINQAERILAENASDPYTEVKLIEQTKVNYMKDIYSRGVKLPQE